MTERGVVAKLRGKKAVVRFDRRSACDSCHMCAVTKDGMKVEVVVDNVLDACVGDVVEVEMGDKFVLTAAVIVYIIPLILVGAGIGIGTLLSELAQILMAVGGLIIGFVLAFVLDRFVIRKHKGFSPTMTVIANVLPVVTENAADDDLQEADELAEAGVEMKTVCARNCEDCRAECDKRDAEK